MRAPYIVSISKNAEFLGRVHVTGEQPEIGIEIIKLIYLMCLNQSGLHQAVHMLGNRGLRIVKRLDQILGTDGFHILIAVHDMPEQGKPDRVRKRIRNRCDQLRIDSLQCLIYSFIPSDPHVLSFVACYPTTIPQNAAFFKTHAARKNALT